MEAGPGPLAIRRGHHGMAYQCPKCSRHGFFWIVDDEIREIDDKIWWYCLFCEYGAEEKEEYARVCSRCGKNSEVYLLDKQGPHWFCASCGHWTPEAEASDGTKNHTE